MIQKEINIVQFKEVGNRQGWLPALDTMYYCNNFNINADIEITYEDDEGNDVEGTERMRCLRIYESYDDMINGDGETYIVREDADWIAMVLPIVVNEDNLIIKLSNTKNLQKEIRI